MLRSIFYAFWTHNPATIINVFNGIDKGIYAIGNQAYRSFSVASTPPPCKLTFYSFKNPLSMSKHGSFSFSEPGEVKEQIYQCLQVDTPRDKDLIDCIFSKACRQFTFTLRKETTEVFDQVHVSGHSTLFNTVAKTHRLINNGCKVQISVAHDIEGSHSYEVTPQNYKMQLTPLFNLAIALMNSDNFVFLKIEDCMVGSTYTFQKEKISLISKY